jgi:hypothetical protein
MHGQVSVDDEVDYGCSDLQMLVMGGGGRVHGHASVVDEVDDGCSDLQMLVMMMGAVICKCLRR